MQNPGQGRARDHSGSSKFHSEKIHPLRQGIPLDPPGIAVGRARRPGRGPGRGALRRGDPRGTAPPRGVRCARARGGADGGDGAPGMRGLVGRAPRAPGAEEPPASSHLPSPAERAPNRGFGVNHTGLLVRASSRRRGRGRRQQAPRSRPGRPVPPGPTVAGVTAAIGYHGRVIPGPGRQALPAWASLVLRRTLFHDRSRADPSMPSAATPMSWASSRASSVHRPAARGAGRPGTGGRVGAEGCRGEHRDEDRPGGSRGRRPRGRQDRREDPGQSRRTRLRRGVPDDPATPRASAAATARKVDCDAWLPVAATARSVRLPEYLLK